MFEITNIGHTCLAVTSILDDNAGAVECPYVANMAGEDLVLDSCFRNDPDDLLSGFP